MSKITGDRKVTIKLNRLAGQEKIGLVGQALFAGGEEVQTRAARLITEGAVSGKNHVPSRPGEPPNEDTGHLRSQIKIYQLAPLRVQIVSEAKYSAALENGSSKAGARPFMGPAARESRKSVVARVEKVIAKVTKG